MDLLSFVLGAAIGACAFAIPLRSARRALADTRAQLLVAEGRMTQLEKHNADLSAQQAQHADLSTLLRPVTEELARVTRAASDADLRRVEAESRILTMIRESKSVNDTLSSGVQQLVSAMSRGQDRGRWGEMQLEQLLEHSGLIEGVNFRRQDARQDGALRPDLVVLLPGGGEVLVDSKFPWDAYFEAMGTDDGAQRLGLLQKHSRDVGLRVGELSKKQYASSSAVSPDFVVLFLPLEPLLSTALDHDGMLLEAAFSKNIILATPTTMLGLLRTIAFAWSRHDLAMNAEAIRDVGAEMLNRLGRMVELFNAHGNHLRRSVDSYNEMLASFDTRVIRQAERMRALGVPAAKGLSLGAELGNDVRHSRAQEPDAAPESRSLAP